MDTNANVQEAAWWGDCANTADEEYKQARYAEFMGIESVYRVKGAGWFVPPYDLRGLSILDIGGGPVSLLLKCINRGVCTVVDPILWPAWVQGRYQEAKIEYIQSGAEEADLGDRSMTRPGFTIACSMLRSAQSDRGCQTACSIVRVFEWLNTEVNEMHPHTFTKDWLDQAFGADGKYTRLNGNVTFPRLTARLFVPAIRVPLSSAWPGAYPHAPRDIHLRLHPKGGEAGAHAQEPWPYGVLLWRRRVRGRVR